METIKDNSSHQPRQHHQSFGNRGLRPWKLRQFFHRGNKANASLSENVIGKLTGRARQRKYRHAGAKEGGGRGDQGTEPTDTISYDKSSIFHNDQGGGDPGRSICASSLGGGEYEEQAMILDLLSISQHSTTLEVRVVNRRDKISESEHHYEEVDDGDVIHRTSVVTSNPATCEDEQGGTEIILRPKGKEVIEVALDKSCHCNGGALQKELLPEPALEVVESRQDSESSNNTTSKTDSVIPRVSITVTIPCDSQIKAPLKPEACQASEHVPTSDSLTWVSHDKDCDLLDNRPVKEISFLTPTSDQFLEEPSSLVSSGRVSSARVRDEIFASFVDKDTGPISVEATGVSQDLSVHHSRQHHHVVVIEEHTHHHLHHPSVPEQHYYLPPPSETVSIRNNKARVEDILEAFRSNGEKNPIAIIRSVASLSKFSNQKGAPVAFDDGSSLSSSDEDDIDRQVERLVLQALSDAQRESKPSPLLALRRVTSGDLKFSHSELESSTSGIEGSRSLDGATNLSNLARKTLRSYGEEGSTPSDNVNSGSRYNRSLADTLSDDEEEDDDKEDKDDMIASSSLQLHGDTKGEYISRIPDMPQRPVFSASRSLLNLEVLTDDEGDESSVMSESLTLSNDDDLSNGSSSSETDSNSDGEDSRDEEEEEDDDDEDDESHLSLSLLRGDGGKEIIVRSDLNSFDLISEIGGDEDSYSSSSSTTVDYDDYDTIFTSRCLYA